MSSVRVCSVSFPLILLYLCRLQCGQINRNLRGTQQQKWTEQICKWEECVNWVESQTHDEKLNFHQTRTSDYSQENEREEKRENHLINFRSGNKFYYNRSLRFTFICTQIINSFGFIKKFLLPEPRQDFNCMRNIFCCCFCKTKIIKPFRFIQCTRTVFKQKRKKMKPPYFEVVGCIV